MPIDAPQRILGLTVLLNDIWLSIGVLPAAFILIALNLLDVQGPARAAEPLMVWESSILLAALNTQFLSIFPLGMAYLAAKSYHTTGSTAFLVVGCGLIFSGVSNFFSGWAVPFWASVTSTSRFTTWAVCLLGFANGLGAFISANGGRGSRQIQPQTAIIRRQKGSPGSNHARSFESTTRHDTAVRPAAAARLDIPRWPTDQRS